MKWIIIFIVSVIGGYINMNVNGPSINYVVGVIIGLIMAFILGDHIWESVARNRKDQN